MRQRSLAWCSRVAVTGAAVLWMGLALASCAPKSDLIDGEGDGDPVPFSPPPEEPGPDPMEPGLALGGKARVTADSLNLRDGIGTSASILTEMPCGATLDVLGGPSTSPSPGWWNVRYVAGNGEPMNGWASGNYLVAASKFVEGSCGGTIPFDGGVAPPAVVAQIFERAKLGVGYSYWWGHGAWRSDGASRGSCTGACPDCDHSGVYGADCSGYISKVWQIPVASALPVDQHPYSTAEFYNDETDWTRIAREQLRPADALVYRANGSGHIALYESGDDPYGDVWVYEARACAAGIVHNLRPFASSYRAIRRHGL